MRVPLRRPPAIVELAEFIAWGIYVWFAWKLANGAGFF